MKTTDPSEASKKQSKEKIASLLALAFGLSSLCPCCLCCLRTENSPVWSHRRSLAWHATVPVLYPDQAKRVKVAIAVVSESFAYLPDIRLAAVSVRRLVLLGILSQANKQFRAPLREPFFLSAHSLKEPIYSRLGYQFSRQPVSAGKKLSDHWFPNTTRAISNITYDDT